LSLIGVIYTIGTAGLRAVRDIRMQLYRKMNRLGLDYFQKERTGMIMSRVINDVEIVGRTLSVEFTEALTNIFYILTHLAFLIYLDWQLLLITLIIVPVLLSPVSNFATRIRRAYTNQQERLADLSGHIQELISGIRVIRAFSMESFEKGRFREINERLYQNTFKGHYYHQVGPALTDLVAAVVIAGFLIWGGFRISTGGVENMGEFLAFFFVLIFIMRPIKQVSVMLNLLSAASAAAARVFYLNDQADGVVSKPDAIALTGFRDRIEFDRVCYRYEGAERDALTDISFEVRQGQTISLVGASGAGKTTLMDLLPRFDDPTSGAIRIDGVDLRDLQLASLRTSIGVVSQEVFLFNASVYENIAYGRNDVPLDRVIEIARAANADEFIQQLPGGYDAQIGERGVMLSGGQRQRLAIARALLMDPPILIFDEATSNLDNESELQVQQAIDRLLKGRTVFMIAHRLSTVFRSDVILVMDQGAIVERGTHKELLENGRIYRKLYDMQFSEGEVQSP
ncbi:MAG: ABC transporter ATP-binding protein, partial [Leptospiraceae bacterium]|nr:ABC transporter ATP-binding protein [Leptospiraceae bacterium]